MEEETYLNSSISRKVVVSSKRITQKSCEESGWTAYFQDLSGLEHSNFSSGSFGSSSMVSDATSYPLLLKKHNVNVPYSSMPKKLNFEKSGAKEISHVDLEDTASSPVNSPKVVDASQTDYMFSSLGKEGISEQFSGIQDEKICETNVHMDNNDHTNLKKKGLCLVPLSFLVNYVG